MKIISKQKDYYDFVVGHDSDPRKVYVRKEEELEKCEDISYGLYDDRFFLGEVWFCDILYPYMLDSKTGRFWYDYYKIPEDVREFINQREASRNSCGYYRSGNVERHFDIELHKFNKRRKYWYSTHFRDIKVKLNTKYGAPVVFSCYRIGALREMLIVKNGLLAEVKFSQVLSPQEAYTTLYNWIPYYEPKMPDDPTDMNRFENKGFSKKTSFRGK